ncbi:hypothetical protein F5Y16DRAFT_93802 [Xylariaceae sp. FL0255]|nr:hypothetical protein F5Y16DRAFT_93802 [Xylariaceae sp. FL0255]
MFLHSGASLHGHEFSRRPAQDAGGNRHSALLRATFSTTPTIRTPQTETQSPQQEYFSSLRQPATHSLRFQEPGVSSTSLPSQLVSDDEVSVTDSDLSRISSVRQRKRRSARMSTTFVLAHPPPKLRTKQRIMHIRPNLLLQIQHVAPGQRPRPMIDVYPSSVLTGSIIAPLLKRFPRINSKRELSIQDIMLIKSEDYSTSHLHATVEGDDDGIISRDLLAILSPLQTEDKAEIVFADGTVWVAKTRVNGNSFSYEFNSVDEHGKTTTVRWVRRPCSVTPTTSNSSPTKIESPDSKFTFSVIDPECRRHPILATLTSSSLSILDQYTTVSQSAGRFPPTKPSLSPPSSPINGETSQPSRETRPVEEWHKALIKISAIWVALCHGWAPNMRPEDLMPSRASTMPPDVEGASHGRRRSLSASAVLPRNSPGPEANGQDVQPIAELPPSNRISRRATSTGAAFIQKRRALRFGGDDRSLSGDHDESIKVQRRALSGDWNIGLIKRGREHTMPVIMDDPPAAVSHETSKDAPLAPSPLPAERRATSVYSPLTSISVDQKGDIKQTFIPHGHNLSEDQGKESAFRARQFQKWKDMANWFRRLSGR